jgi:hypothetical protein
MCLRHRTLINPAQLKALIVFTALLFFGSANAAYGDMDPATCEPSGLLNKIKAKSNPLNFWAEMYIDSSSAIKLHTEGDPEVYAPHTVRDCQLVHQKNIKELQLCVWRIQNVINYWTKCNLHAQRMCRLNGGRC